MLLVEFDIIAVYTIIIPMTIEQELKTSRFQSEIHKAELNILFTASWLKNQVNRRLKHHDLTHEQLNVLCIIRGHHPNPVCVRDITERMIDRNSNTTRLLDKLADKRLIRREPSQEDRRELCVYLTESAQKLLLSIDALEEKPHLVASPSLTELEAQLLNVLLNKLRETL